MAKINIPFNKAANLAERIKEELSVYCQRIEIAGSIRRKKPVIGDIEIVCIPYRQADLFGNPAADNPTMLDVKLNELIKTQRLIKGNKYGEKYKQVFIPAIEGLTLDLFITTSDQWPVIYAIRTGSADYSKRLVTQKKLGGLLPDIYRVQHGRVWNDFTPLELTEERAFLDLAGGWVEPEFR